jgi:ADP-ribosyl-[dinitrogen reductase] hydrolase
MKTEIAPELLTQATNARRLLLMVAELHKLGYEGMRATPFMSPSGCYWRCCIVPAYLTSRTHGARLAENVDYETLPRYSSANGDDYFGWANMKPKTPLILAKRFIVEFAKFAEQGKHPDPAYVRWFSNMLETTAPHGVIYAFADGESPTDRMFISFCDETVVVRVPLVWGGW